MAMDPFEARLQFIQYLETLNPSTQAITKTVSFALKNKELHEDFHSCILEVLDKIDLNSRINVLYFIEALVSSITGGGVMSKDGGDDGEGDGDGEGEGGDDDDDEKEKLPYLNNLEKDFAIILGKIIPDTNLINLKSSVDILINIEKFYNINNLKYKEIFDNISINKLNNNDEILNSIKNNGKFSDSWKFLIKNKQNGLKMRIKQFEMESGEILNDNHNNFNKLKPFTKDQILNRIESDRERHKRFKEINWIINRSQGKIDKFEFNKIWENHNELNNDDYQDLKELNKIAKNSYQV